MPLVLITRPQADNRGDVDVGGGLRVGLPGLDGVFRLDSARDLGTAATAFRSCMNREALGSGLLGSGLWSFMVGVARSWLYARYARRVPPDLSPLCHRL